MLDPLTDPDTRPEPTDSGTPAAVPAANNGTPPDGPPTAGPPDAPQPRAAKPKPKPKKPTGARETVSRTPPPSTAPSARLDDALAVFAGRIGGTTPRTRLTAMSVTQDEQLMMPISTRVCAAAVHYVTSLRLKGYCRCRGADCALCLLGRRADERHLLPVYDPVARRVAVLPVPPSVRVGALAPQLLPVLGRVAAGEVLLVGVRRGQDYTYHVRELPLPVDADTGDDVVVPFAEALARGDVDLASVYPTMTAADVAAIPELAAEARLRGVPL